MKPIQNFGKKGIALMFYTAVLMFICGCVNTGMTQTVIPIISETRGWDGSVMLSWVTYGSWIGVIACVLWGQLLFKKGAKLVAVLGLVGGGIAIAVYGNAPALPVLCLAIVLNRVFSTAYQNNAANALINTWFPRKKGIVFGWVTMGIIFCDIIWLPMITAGVGNLGLKPSLLIVAVVFFALAVIGLIWLKNTPEEAGVYPDNQPEGVSDLKQSLTELQAYKSPWTVARMLKEKAVWLTGVGIGFLWLCAVGCLSQNVPRIMSFGYGRAEAVTIVSISAVFALVGSYAFGKADTVFGTKKACQIYGIVQAAALILVFLQPFGTIFIWLSSCLLYSCIGGIANLAPSMIGTLFGRKDFAAANRLLNPMIYAIYSTSFLVVSRCLEVFGNYESVYIVFLALTAAGFAMVCAIDTEAIKVQHSKESS
ncbi:MAG: OFA family MFS transporter [Eubacterium sp.]|nr:OFA family MFS transporter [Eubacterium sp.]